MLTVALVGDSIAGNWFTPLEQIAAQRHWELVTELHAACPWTATQLYDPVNKGSYPTCYQWGVTVLHDLTATIRPDVVIASGLQPASPRSRIPVAAPQSRADLGAGMATYWKDLETHGIPVIGIQETPNMEKDEPRASRSTGPPATPAPYRGPRPCRPTRRPAMPQRDLGGRSCR